MIGVYDYTVILTYLSLLSACTGTMLSMSGLGHPYIGMMFMLFSGLCDAFDGRVAGTKKDRTPMEKAFGVQIDSFSDLVAFGVLPAAIGMSLLRVSARFSDMPYRYPDSGKLCWYPVVLIATAMLYILAAMIRLAYFNVTEEERRAEAAEKGAAYFTGLPVTSAALVFPLVLLVHFFLRFDLSIVYFVVMFLMATLFIGRFKVRKPGKKALLWIIGIGAAEFLGFVLIRLLGSGK